MFLRVLCVLLSATLVLSIPAQMTDDQYINQLLRYELQKEMSDGDQQAQESGQYQETFGKPYRGQYYEQVADLKQDEQQNANTEGPDFEQQKNDNDEYVEQNQNNLDGTEGLQGGIEQFDQDDSQQLPGGVEPPIDHNQQMNEPAVQANGDDEQGGIEHFEQNQGWDQQNNDQSSGDTWNQDNNDRLQSGYSPEQEKIDKLAIDKLYSDNNAGVGEEDAQFTDVFGNKPEVNQNVDYEQPPPPPTKKPSWFRRAWHKTKEGTRKAYQKVKETFG